MIGGIGLKIGADGKMSTPKLLIGREEARSLNLTAGATFYLTLIGFRHFVIHLITRSTHRSFLILSSDNKCCLSAR